MNKKLTEKVRLKYDIKNLEKEGIFLSQSIKNRLKELEEDLDYALSEIKEIKNSPEQDFNKQLELVNQILENYKLTTSGLKDMSDRFVSYSLKKIKSIGEYYAK